MDPTLQPWPPRPVDLASTTPAPMFPLPGVYLFPGQMMPLHIFEPRYRAMVEDSLDSTGRIVIATVLAAHRAALPGSPPVVDVAGIGEIARHERLPDGRFLLWLCGLGRVRIHEVPSEAAYRRVRFTPLLDIEPSMREVTELRPCVLDAIRRRTGTDLSSHEAAPLGVLADLLAQCLTLPESVMTALHGEMNVAERARKAIAAERRFPATTG